MTLDPLSEFHRAMAQAQPSAQLSAADIERDFEAVSGMLKSRAERIGEALDETLARRDEGSEHFRATVHSVADDMVGLLSSGKPVNVDGLIEKLGIDERDYVRTREKISKQTAEILRSKKDLSQEDIVILNRANMQLALRLNELARACRDARWKLMAARAEFEPSDGVGPIRGQGEPV